MGLQLRLIVGVLSGLAALGVMVRPAAAAISQTGNVLLSPDSNVMDGPYTGLYNDNPFTTTINEGIPANNAINQFRGNTGAPLFQFIPNEQVEYEGRPVFNGAGMADDTNVNFSIIVGRTSFGELVIGEAQLRDMDLVIGDQAQVGTTIQRGSGVVRITGPASLYNNNPFMMPYVGVDPDTITPLMISKVPRPITVGYDLLVGRYGSGVLQLFDGGRAEIQDAVLVGDQSGSVGTITIDGIDSFLQSGGFETTTGSDPDAINYMIVGRLGSGTMSITNGGQSYNAGPIATSGNAEQWAAVIGSNFAADDANPPSAGGNGLVVVDGIASKWTLAGNLQVGGFHNNRIGMGPLSEEDLEGELAVYGAGVGRGTLRVTNGGLVSIVSPQLDDTGSNAPDRLDFLVGRFGKVELDGGRIELLGAFDGSNPNDPTQEVTRGRLINDGFVGGHGNISVLQFRNRVLGEVGVAAGQSLTIAATGEYLQADNIPLPTEPEEYPLSNYGVIKALGTVDGRASFIIDRNHVTLPTATDFTRPFLNLPVPGPPIAPNGRTEGLIHAEYANLQFNSGLWNRGVLAFTQGNNVVSGDVISFGESAPGAGDRGRVLIGPDTNVAFEDDFFTLGVTQISPGATFQVLKGNSFAVGGTYSMSITATTNGLILDSPIPLITGNASFSGDLQVSISGANNIMGSVAVPIFSIGGNITGNFTTVTPSGLPFGSSLDLFTFVFGQQLYLAAFDFALANGPDLNGDGFVDALDHAIWKQNFGSMGTPGDPLAGDTNGDGKVDASDYTVWRNACCGPFPGAGSGGAFPGWFESGVAVPEPTSALLMLGGVLALAMQRRPRS